MDKQSERSSAQYGIGSLLIATAFVAVLVCSVHYLRKPIRDARQIQTGDKTERVHELLGTPTLVFNSDAEMRASHLAPFSFVFSDTGGANSEVPAPNLPVVTTRAEWFEYTPTAGHLVYYDEHGVEIVFWGGT